MKRKTLEYAKSKFLENGLILLDEEYKSVDKPMKCKDENGYLFNRTLRTVEDNLCRNANYNKIFDIRNTYFWENIKHYFVINDCNGTILLSKKTDMKNHKSLLEFSCGKCGRHFKKTWKSFLRLDNKICSECYKKERIHYDFVEKRRNTITTYQEAAKKIQLEILDECIENTHSKVMVQDEFGYKGVVCASCLLKGSSFEKFSVRNPYSIYNINLYIKKNEIKAFVPEQKFRGVNYPITVQCFCGNYFEVNLYHFFEGTIRCKSCRQDTSLISQKVKLWLINNQYEYIQEYSFKDCKYKKTLKFDFYLPKFNACIEVDGIQHYKPIGFGEKDKEKIINKFSIVKHRDTIKNEYCTNNGIPLLRIPFWEIEKSNNYMAILEQFILSLQK